MVKRRRKGRRINEISTPKHCDPDHAAAIALWLGLFSASLIPDRAFIAKRSGWSKRWPSQGRMMNRDTNGVAHFPGWSQNVLRYLFEERCAVACGHETTDTDSGMAISRNDVSLETYLLGLDRWQIELLSSLEQVPENGAIVVASWPKPKAGSGFPARVFAIF